MKIVICHLSDIHFKDGTNIISGRVGKISDALRSVDGGSKTCCIVISGDVAYSGKSSEYEQALTFVVELQDRLSSIFKTVNVVVVPGNHDCDFESAKGDRKMVLKAISETEDQIDLSVVLACTKIQENFFIFRDTVSTAVSGKTDRLFCEYSFALEEGHTVTFRCFNTAWISEKKERQGQLMLPLPLLPPCVVSSEKIIIISLFHHSYVWLRAENARRFRKYVEQNSDLVFTGHEHDQDTYIMRKTSGEISGYFEGGVLQDHDLHNLSSFSVLVADLGAKKQKVFQFSWAKDYYEPSQEGGWTDFEKNRMLRNNLFENSRHFENEVTDLGTGFLHPRKDKLSILDLFVYPDFVDIAPGDKPGKFSRMEFPRIYGDNILAVLAEHKKLLIGGAEKSGRTSLAKMLYLDMKAKGLIPVMIRGEQIKHPNYSYLSSQIQDLFSQQYNAGLYQRYAQLDKDVRMLIIDDFHEVRLNQDGKRKIVELAENMFSSIVVLGDQLIGIEELTSREKGTTSCFVNFRYLQIREFGHVLRNKLIEKWLTLGQEYELDDQQLSNNADRIDRLVTIVLGKNLVPSYPVFILTLIQAMEAGRPIDKSAGTYGFFYQFLITEALLHPHYAQIDLDTKLTYLSLLAFKMFVEKRSSLSGEELLGLSMEYGKIYREISHDKILAELQSSRVILQHEDQETYSFTYPYVFYYFMAKYVADHITKEAIKKILRDLIAQVHREDYANIIVFLSYLSKDPFILEEITKVSRTLFSDITPIDIIDETLAVDRHFSKGELKLVFPEAHLDGKSNRRQLLKVQDELEEIEKARAGEDEEHSAEEVAQDVPKFVIELNRAMKSIQVLGQIVKNRPGSIEKSDKIAMVEECYSLGMRSLGKIFKMIQGLEEDLVNDLVDTMTESKPHEDRDVLIGRARTFVFKILELFTFSLVKMVSQSLGSDRLLDVYKEVKENSNNSSFLFIDLTIKLEHLESFPEKDLRHLHGLAKGKVFPEFLLQLLCADYLYVSLIAPALKQKILALVGIPVRKAIDIKKKDVKFQKVKRK